MQHEEFPRLAAALETMHTIYLSGISLAILPPLDRGRLLQLKMGAGGALCSDGAAIYHVAAEPLARVIDTTAAGDAFGAAFLFGQLHGPPSQECCNLGNQLARSVIQHRGAIIPAGAMPPLHLKRTS